MRTLKTIAAVTAAFAIGATGASAQTIGFKLGAGFANMTTDQAGVTAEGITGFAGGGHLRMGLGQRLGLQLEVLSVTKGANFRGSALNDYDLRFEYVELPVTVHVPLTMGGVAPYVFGGAAVGLEVRCRVTPVAGGGAAGVERDCGDGGVGQLNRASPDFSLLGGAGLALAVGPGSVIVEGRYTAGMRNINDAAAGPNMRNRVATIMAGYELPLVRSW
jgi:hypothetical protein